MTQQGDVELFQTNDGGDITVVGGIVSMVGGLGVAAYLSLFGGNENDDGLQDNIENWWANIDETEPSREYRSETQNLIRGIPASSNNLKRIEDAAIRDLAWFLTESIASTITVAVSIPGLNMIKIVVTIEAEGVESKFEYVENWKVMA